MANVAWHLRMVEENAKREKTRLRMQTAHDNIAKKENVPLLEGILVLRDTMAHKLGYANWADYTIEVNMAGNTEASARFHLGEDSRGIEGGVRGGSGNVAPTESEGTEATEGAA